MKLIKTTTAFNINMGTNNLQHATINVFGRVYLYIQAVLAWDIATLSPLVMANCSAHLGHENAFKNYQR